MYDYKEKYNKENTINMNFKNELIILKNQLLYNEQNNNNNKNANNKMASSLQKENEKLHLL